MKNAFKIGIDKGKKLKQDIINIRLKSLTNLNINNIL